MTGTLVTSVTKQFPMKFYNTAIPKNLGGFDAPVVLTVNPGKQTDDSWAKVFHTPNLMFVRVRANLWNSGLTNEAIQYYSGLEVPIILTFMAYYEIESIPQSWRWGYIQRKRTINSYWAITTDAWLEIMDKYRLNKWVYPCGKIEGEKGTTACRHCGNCLREYFATIERMKVVE
jgi:hypothetical protein